MNKPLLRKGKLALFFILLLFCDIVSKYYTNQFIPKMSYLYPVYPFGGIGIFQNFFHCSLSISFVQNRGAAWGLFSGMPHLLFYSRIVIVAALTIYAVFFNTQKKRDIPLFLILTGALGNILDTIIYGYVVDMVHVTVGSYSFPVFNLADTMISLGIFWLFFLSFRCSSCQQRS